MFSSSDTPPDTPRQPKLLERMRTHLRTRHYSLRTEQATEQAYLWTGRGDSVFVPADAAIGLPWLDEVAQPRCPPVVLTPTSTDRNV